MKKLIVITGASSGIGAAMARKFSEAGHPLLLLARRLDAMLALNLPNALCKQVDVCDLESFRAAIDEAESLYGATDCLINNAGVMLLGHPAKQNIAEWNTMIDVNIKGLLNGIHLVVDGMVKHNTGTIINIGSVAGKKTSKHRTVYCGTKFAVHAISETLRQELSSSNIRVSLIAPGVVETELLEHTTDEEIVANYEVWKKSMGRGLDSMEVASAAYYIYSQPQDVCIREIVLSKTQQEI